MLHRIKRATTYVGSCKRSARKDDILVFNPRPHTNNHKFRVGKNLYLKRGDDSDPPRKNLLIIMLFSYLSKYGQFAWCWLVNTGSVMNPEKEITMISTMGLSLLPLNNRNRGSNPWLLGLSGWSPGLLPKNIVSTSRNEIYVICQGFSFPLLTPLSLNGSLRGESSIC